MSVKGVMQDYLYGTAAAALERNRLVNLTKTTDVVAYATFGSNPDGVTTARATAIQGGSGNAAYKASVYPIAALKESFFLLAYAAVTKGAALFVGSAAGDVVVSKGTKADYATLIALGDMVAGDVWFVTTDQQYFVYNGAAWAKAPIVAFAAEAAAAGAEFVAYRSKAVEYGSLELDFYVDSAAENDVDATVTVTDARITAASLVFPVLLASTAAVGVGKCIAGAGSCACSLSGNGGVGTQVRLYVMKRVTVG